MAKQCGVRVYDALRHAGGPRRVDDHQRVRSVDIAFHRGEQRFVDRLGEPVNALDVTESPHFAVGVADADTAQLGSGGAEYPFFRIEVTIPQHLPQMIHVVMRAE